MWIESFYTLHTNSFCVNCQFTLNTIMIIQPTVSMIRVRGGNLQSKGKHNVPDFSQERKLPAWVTNAPPATQRQLWAQGPPWRHHPSTFELPLSALSTAARAGGMWCVQRRESINVCLENKWWNCLTLVWFVTDPHLTGVEMKYFLTFLTTWQGLRLRARKCMHGEKNNQKIFLKH